MIKNQGQAWLRTVQAIVTLVLLIFLGRSIKWPDFFHLMTHAHWKLVLLSVALLLICHLINVSRWQYLMQQNSLPYMKLLAFYGIGLFSNNFLPTGIGGDGVRAILTNRYVSLPVAIVSVGLDRIIGLSTLGVVFILGLWLGLPVGMKIEKAAVFYQIWRTPVIIILIMTLVGLLGLVGIVKIQRLRSWVRHFISRLIGPAVLPRWKGRHWIKLLSGAYGLSLVAQAIHIAAYWVILEALNIHISSSASLWLVLVGSVIILLPISINGLGLQEGGYVVVLNAYGIETTAAIGFALTVRILMVMFSLVGGLFLLGGNLTSNKIKKGKPI